MKRIVFLTFCLFCTVATLLAQDDDAKYATQLLEVGTTAPDLSLPTIDGKNLSLNDFRGKYVVLEFWLSDTFRLIPTKRHGPSMYSKIGKTSKHTMFATSRR